MKMNHNAMNSNLPSFTFKHHTSWYKMLWKLMFQYKKSLTAGLARLKP